MRRLLFILPLLSAEAAFARDPMLDSLLKVEPRTRLEQVCDLEAMKQIRRDTKLRVDRAKSDVITTPVHADHTLTVKGGAFRAAGKWYRLSFVCKASPDHLHVTFFTYQIGDPIPEAQWSSLGLWR